ncbi:hypothetical protein X801_00021, partial [Opisthorchis viverrini]
MDQSLAEYQIRAAENFSDFVQITLEFHSSASYTLTIVVGINVHDEWFGNANQPNISSIGLGLWTTHSEIVKERHLSPHISFV